GTKNGGSQTGEIIQALTKVILGQPNTLNIKVTITDIIADISEAILEDTLPITLTWNWSLPEAHRIHLLHSILCQSPEPII
uniref:hypothetical protein n=1 Tax=Salmonella enterica TaxID=28901 RepID=UPI0035237DED